MVLMLFAMIETEQLPVSVFQNTLATHTLPADQNALSTQTVHQTSLVKGTSVLTRVQEHAVSMHNAA